MNRDLRLTRKAFFLKSRFVNRKSAFSLELIEETLVAFVEEADVVDLVFDHRQAINTDAEGKALPELGI